MTGAFSVGDAVVTFSYLAVGGLAVGGLAVGGLLGFLWVKSLRLLNDPSLIIVAAVLLPWAAYIGGEALHVSGVISTVSSCPEAAVLEAAVLTARSRCEAIACTHSSGIPARRRPR